MSDVGLAGRTDKHLDDKPTARRGRANRKQEVDKSGPPVLASRRRSTAAADRYLAGGNIVQYQTIGGRRADLLAPTRD